MVRSQILPRREPLASQPEPEIVEKWLTPEPQIVERWLTPEPQIVEKWMTRKVYKVFWIPRPEPTVKRDPIIVRLPPPDKLPIRLIWAILALLGLQTAILLAGIINFALTWTK